MAIETHKCPIKSCSAACPRHHAMCVSHWRMVPKHLQALVYAAYRRLTSRRVTQAAVNDHRKAVDDAIAAVHEKLEKKDARRQKDQRNLLDE